MLLRGLIRAANKRSVDYTYGMKTKLSLGGQHRKIIILVNAVTRSQGATFIAFIQPFAFYKSKHALNSKISKPKGRHYREKVLSLYEEVTNLTKVLPYVHDATEILESHDDVYRIDGAHLTRKGDRIVAEFVFKNIEPLIR